MDKFSDLISNLKQTWNLVKPSVDKFIEKAGPTVQRLLQEYGVKPGKTTDPSLSKAVLESTDRRVMLTPQGLAPATRCSYIVACLRKLALDLTLIDGFAKDLKEFLKSFNTKYRHPQKLPVETLSEPAMDLAKQWVGKGLSEQHFNKYEKTIDEHKKENDTLGLLTYLVNFELKASGSGVEKERD